jgi:diguanylate cyclase (GGDEF)-like protein
LTGLLDRRSFDRALADMATQRTTIVIAFIDVDHFKAVNDTYGHTVGDEVLRTIAGALASGARSGDVVARIGGDEFCVVASVDQTSHDTPDVVGRRLLNVVATALAAIPQRVTVSVGIGGPGDAGNAVQLREAADSAMYLAKRSGGGRFEVATPPSSH